MGSLFIGACIHSGRRSRRWSPFPARNSELDGKFASGNPLLNQRSGNLGSTETTSPRSPSCHRPRRAPGPTASAVQALRRHIGGDEEGREAAAGEQGELWLGGPMVVKGYWAWLDR